MLHGVDRANVYLVMELGGRCIPCLLDTGCDLTMVPREVINRVADVEIRPTTHRMWAANCTEVRIQGEATIPFVMEGRRLDTTALVSPDIEEPMIGSEWMKAHRCLWDFQGSQLYIDDRAAVTLTQRKKLRCRRLYADQEVVVPARHQVVVPARATLFSLKWPTGNTIVETRQMEPGVYLGRTLFPPEHRGLRVSIVNTTAEPRTVAVGESLGNLHDVEVLPGQDCGTSSAEAVTTTGDRKQSDARTDRQQGKPVPIPRDSVVNVRPDQQQQRPVPAPRKSVGVRAATVSTSDEIVSSLLQQLPADLEVEQRRQVSQFLQKYQDVFSKSTYDMGRTTLVEHEINTGGHPPIRQDLRRHPIAHLDIIDEQVREMVQNDLVEPAASP